MHATVLIATHNRARLLDATLNSIARMRVPSTCHWEAVVVDNNSTDNTRAIVEAQIADFPVRLRYLFESRPGRSNALNTGIAQAEGDVLAFTDDDVQVAECWLEAGMAPLVGSEAEVDYTGGPVHPMWEAAPPRWLNATRADLWSTIAILDYGSESFIFEDRRRVPVGANMAVRRDLFRRIGGFRADLGRTQGRLVLGQEVPELLMRARSAGRRGRYVPAMAVQHHVPAARLTRAYFRRWWFGKGVSKAFLERLQPVTELGIDLRETPHLFDVPRFMYGSAVRDVSHMVRDRLLGRQDASFRHEMMVTYFAGYAWARWWRDRGPSPGPMRHRRQSSDSHAGPSLEPVE